MQTLPKYLVKGYLVVLGMTLAGFTFVLHVGAVTKVFGLMARGVSGAVIFQSLAFNVPYILSFSIPISSLTAVLLLFRRLSSDGEVTAMKACGLGMRQICAPIVLVTSILSLICIYLNAYIAPNGHYAHRRLLHEVGGVDPVDLLQEGVYVRDFPGVIIYVGRKMRNKVQDVIVHEIDEDGWTRTIRAESGVITSDEENKQLTIDLFKARIDTVLDRADGGDDGPVSADPFTERLDYGHSRETGAIRKQTRDYTLPELVRGIRDIPALHENLDTRTLQKQRMGLMIEASRRCAMSFCCLAFTLIAIPLGMRSKRKKPQVGVLISVGVVFAFYFFVMVAKSLYDKPFLRPDLIIWIPLFVAQFIGIRLILEQE